MTTATMGQVVDAIPLAPPRVSLLSSVDVVTGDGDWLNGIMFTPEHCTPPENPYWWTCPPSGGAAPTQTKDIPDPEDVVNATPFDIWVGFKCGNQAVRNGDYQNMARRAMEAFQSSLIERELWTGTVAQAAGFPNDYLENTPDAINGGAATPYVTALAELEQALATCQPGQIGVIHAQPRTVTTWLQNGLVTAEASGRRLRTQLGTIVVPGAGYPGTGAGLGAATKDAAWAYGTGMVRVYLGALSTVPEDNVEVDRTVNDIRVRVERAAVAVWDECCQPGVQVDHNVAL